MVTKLVGSSLITAMWLQLAQVIGGERGIRKCEICNEWMDITQAERKGSKRVQHIAKLARN